MKTYNLKQNFPTQLEAGKKLSEIIQSSKSQNLKVIKVIHGYGSTGVGGTLKHSIRRSLRNRRKKKEIKAFIPGDAFYEMLGFDEVINEYKHLIKHDRDYGRNNEGITYIIL